MINRDPDVRFFIRYAGVEAKQLTFQLLVRDPAWGPISEEYGPIPLNSDPFDFQTELKKELGNLWRLAKRGSLEADDAQRRLAGIAISLFRQLPEKLQDRFWSLLGRARTIQIISNEPRIPWELMKLQKREELGHWQKGKFLCEAFAVTRWLHNMIGSLQLPISDIALVVPCDANLKESKTEREDVLSLAGPERRVQEIKPIYRAVTEALSSGEHDSWHFCGHGTVSARFPNSMAFKLLGEEHIRPQDITAYGEGLGRRQPLVFFNACETGESGFSLTSLGGWAHEFLGAGAGAFLGTLWPVDDRVAREFARFFYRRFLGGETIAEAMLQTRLHVRDKFPGDPSWLAYTVFAHPFAIAQEKQSISRPESSARQRDLGTGYSTTQVKDFGAAPPDVRIRVHSVFRAGETHLEFHLDSPSGALGFDYQNLTGPVIVGSPEEYRAQWRRLSNRIEKLSEGLDIDDGLLLEEHVKSKLDGIGRDLYRELLPTGIRQAYRHFRKRELSLMIVTDEPWIPWEMIKPYDDSDLNDLIDDDFLCLEFPMTRWLMSANSPTMEIRVRHFAFLGDEAFPRSGVERRQLYAFAGKHSEVEDVSPNEPTMEALEDLLDSNGAELLHFAGPFIERTFRPEDLHGPRATKIRRSRPLVLFNYQSGLEGWERRWLEDCGCGAFVGLSWPPRDSLAYEFVATLYDALGRGQTFGWATLEARRRLYALSPGSLAWLAYKVYAHVNGRLVLGGSGTEQESIRDLA